MILSLLSIAFFTSLSFPQSQIVVGLHASWDNDLTDDIPPKCVTSGTVAVPYFHFVVAYKFPVVGVSVDWYRVEETPQQHIPAQAQFDNPQGSFGVPSCASLLVSDPQNWQWVVFPCLPDPTVGFALHNTNYTVTVQWRYGVYMQGPRGPFQTSITVRVENLVVGSGDERKLLMWDPERPNISDTTISYTLQCAQRKRCRVTIEVYNLLGQKIYQETQTKLCPDSYSWTWNGQTNIGVKGIAPWGLYTFNIHVEGASPYDRDSLRSTQLAFLRWAWTPRPAQARGGFFAYEESIAQIAYALGSSRVSGRVKPDDRSNDCTLFYKSVRLEDGSKYAEERKKPLLIPINTQSFVSDDYDLIDWFPILSGRPGNWALVLEAKEGNSYAGAYKSHTPKWAIPVGGEVTTPSAAFFHYDVSAGDVGNQVWNVLPYGALLEWDNVNNKWTIAVKPEYYTRYHDWRWWDIVNRQFITEPINSGSRTIEIMMKALRRVGIWFYIGHSTYTTRNGIPYLLFGQAIWGTDGFILSSEPPLDAYNPSYGSVKWTPSASYSYYAISNLPMGDLSRLRLAVIVSCAGAGGDFPQSYPLLDWTVAKGCPLALGLVVNAPLTKGTKHPPGINTGFAIQWAQYFWRYATKGVRDPIKDEYGNILQPGGRWDVLAAANKALAMIGIKPRLISYRGISVIAVDGPSLLGARPYTVYFSYQPNINPSNYYISPAMGGRDDRALRTILTSNLYP